MQPGRRLVFSLMVALGLVAIVPVATALGDNPPDDTTRRMEAVTALGSGFSYQGRLTDAGSPANGAYDLRFILYDAETGGAQVGSTVEKGDVAVTNGLFSTDLDFGASAFNGDARWIELAIRPGASTGTYTVLSPRQAVTPAPYALYAKATGGFQVPLSVTGTSTGAPATSTGLLTVSQAGTGIALSGQRTTTDAAQYPAVIGTNAGGGAGVQGESTFATGVGVQGFGNGAIGFGGYFTGNVGVKAVGQNGAAAGSAALELDGPLKVSGVNPTAFIHTVSATCNTSSASVIDNPLVNGDPNAILIVTPRGTSGGYTATAVGVTYNPSGATCAAGADKWVIFTLDASAITALQFNVMVIRR
jgi:hypothetical protein